MKRSLSLVVEIVVKLCTSLAVCIGCSSKNLPGPEQPRVIHWKGQDSGCEDTTTVPPADNASSIDKK